MKYRRMVQLLAARNCYESGAEVKDLATQTGKSTTTIRRWLRLAGVT